MTVPKWEDQAVTETCAVTVTCVSVEKGILSSWWMIPVCVE